MPIVPSGNADFTPTRGNYKDLKPFRFWCQKVLPAVYDDSLSYYELLTKVVDYLNMTMEDVETSIEDIDNIRTAYTELQDYVNDTLDDYAETYNDFEGRVTTTTENLMNAFATLQGFINDYFENLDVQEEIDNKLDEMVLDGTLDDLIEPIVQSILNSNVPVAVGAWLEQYVDPTTMPIVDYSLKISGAAGDSETTGESFNADRVKMDILHNTVNYGYDVQELDIDDESADVAKKVGVKRLGSEFIINGTSDSVVSTRIKLNGTLDRDSTNNYLVNWDDGLTLVEGHKYKASLILVDGEVNYGGVAVYKPRLDVDEIGSGTSIGDNPVYDGLSCTREFTAGSTDVNLVLWISNGTEFDGAKYQLLVQDMTVTEAFLDEIVADALEVVSGLTEDAEAAADRAESAAETLELDATLTSATKAAQAKAVGDALAEIVLIAPKTIDKYVTQSSAGVSFYGKGYVSLTGGRYVANESYDTFLWTPSEQTDIYIVRTSGTYLRAVEYNSDMTTLPSSNTNSYFVRGGGHEENNASTLPTSDNRWTVPAGHTIAITRINATYVSNFRLYYRALVDEKKLADDIIIPDSTIESNSAFQAVKNNSLINNDEGTFHASKTGTVAIVTENEPHNFVYNKANLVRIVGSNRFNISSKSFTKNSSTSDATVTKTATGVKVESNDTSGNNRFVYFNYTAEYTGKLWISAEASCETAKTNDCRIQIVVNSTEQPMDCVGTGLLKRYVNVTVGDSVQVRLWYHLYTSTDANTVEYNNIMLSYADCQYEPYLESINQISKGCVLTFAESETVEYDYFDKTNKIKVACFGDSITGMFDYGADYCYWLEHLMPSDCVNIGFSGSTWADHPSTHYVPFSINRLIDSIVANDFSYQDDHVGSIDSDFYALHLANLKALDFSTVSVVTFLAGTNDWAFDIPLLSGDDTSETNKQRTNVQDAVTYSVERLLEKYPHLVIIVLCPYWRRRTGNEDSNVTPNGNGVYLYQVSDTIQQCAESKNQNTINLYRTLGATWQTQMYYTIDGTHPNTRTKVAIAERIKNAIEISGLI